MTTHLDHITYCNTSSGPNWSKDETYRVFIINARRDQISVQEMAPITLPETLPSFEPGKKWLQVRHRANMAPIRQSKPDYGLGFEVEILTTIQVVPSSLGSGTRNSRGNSQRGRFRAKGNYFKVFKSFCLKADARIWPWLTNLCHIRSMRDAANNRISHGNWFNSKRWNPMKITADG